jgi:hypothetical protein
MKIVVFGATGPTGRHVVQRALELGHEVTAFARTPAAVDLRHDKLTVVPGDVLDPVAVDRAVAGHDVVISALGPRNRATRGPAAAMTVASEGVRHILAAMKAHGVRRLIALSSVGVGATKGKSGFLLERVFRPLFLGPIFDDKGPEHDRGGQPHLAARGLAGGLDRLVRLLGRGDDPLAAGEVVGPEGRDGHGARRAVEQRDAEALLEAREPPADRRLRQAQRPRGPAQAAQLHHPHEHQHVVEPICHAASIPALALPRSGV